MSLYQDWVDYYEGQTEQTFQKFWEDYSKAEQKIYGDLLKNKQAKLSGTIASLAEKFDVTNVLMMGFIDGINTSITPELDVENLGEDTAFEAEIDWEKLYFNMQDAGAEHLYNLPEWDSVLDEEKRQEIEKAYKKSKTVVKPPKIGRNDPCPCGSGKKYKNCCGRNA